MNKTVKSKKQQPMVIHVNDMESTENDLNRKLSEIMFLYQGKIDELNHIISKQNDEIINWCNKFDNIMKHVYNKKHAYSHELVLSSNLKLVKSSDVLNPKFGVYELIDDNWVWKAAFPDGDELISFLYNKNNS